MDLLALINNGVNFILYCTMSRQFRKTFQKTFCCNCICFFRPIDKQTTVKSIINIRSGGQMQNRSSLPNEKFNLLNKKITQNSIHFGKKASLNEIDDDDQELVTMNETKQNSSTVEMDDDYLVALDNEGTNYGNKIRKSSIKQSTIIECKENYVEEPELSTGQVLQRQNSSERSNTSIDNIGTSLLIMKTSNQTVNETPTSNEENLKPNEELEPTNEDLQTKMEISTAKLRMHRNSSIDLTCDRPSDNRRNNLLHRYNDSRRRRRKTTSATSNMGNIGTDCKTCV